MVAEVQDADHRPGASGSLRSVPSLVGNRLRGYGGVVVIMMLMILDSVMNCMYKETQAPARPRGRGIVVIRLRRYCL